MSPYRVLVTTDIDTPGASFVLSSMISRDKCGNRTIYIVRKTIPVHLSDYVTAEKMHRVAAHLYATDKNSVRVDRYDVKELAKHDYQVEHGSTHNIVIVHEGKLANCLQQSMNDYCSRNNLAIIEQL